MLEKEGWKQGGQRQGKGGKGERGRAAVVRDLGTGEAMVQEWVAPFPRDWGKVGRLTNYEDIQEK